jgi:hypothetical protein
VAVDLNGALRTFLKADSAVATASSGRVYGQELPRTENPSMPRAAVVLKAAGGMGGLAYLRLRNRRVDVDCYGATMREAEQLYVVVSDCLKQMRRNVTSSVLIHSADISSDGVSARDPETDWPMCVGSFQVLAAETAAT